jgi:hypothetical protein
LLAPGYCNTPIFRQAWGDPCHIVQFEPIDSIGSGPRQIFYGDAAVNPRDLSKLHMPLTKLWLLRLSIFVCPGRPLRMCMFRQAPLVNLTFLVTFGAEQKMLGEAASGRRFLPARTRELLNQHGNVPSRQDERVLLRPWSPDAESVVSLTRSLPPAALFSGGANPLAFRSSVFSHGLGQRTDLQSFPME